VTRNILVSSSRKRRFVDRLLRWYARHGRDLPWRRTRNPYRVLVSEIMLQQTPVSRVIPKYREWLRRYPSLEALAHASVREVRETWSPLGYNIRPLRLREIARTVLRRHRGRLPMTKDALLTLKGIGPYTAGAVLTFAYGRAEPIVDTNVRRVLRRIFCGRRPRSDRQLWALSAALLPSRDAYNFNQALMDFGATVCTARAPRCPTCPMRRMCAMYASTRSGAKAFDGI
jgi:A/G-specific adenine glycosylase